MKFICMHGRTSLPSSEDSFVAVETNNADRVRNYVYGFFYEAKYDPTVQDDIFCLVAEYDENNKFHRQIAEAQNKIFWEV